MGLDALKPSRSDELISREDQLRGEREVRDIFEAAAPKRPHKPARSDEEEGEVNGQVPPEIPELRKFQELEASDEHLDFTGNGVVSGEEFVETEYYKDLLVAESGQHHTTGSGFIKVTVEGPEAFHVESEDPYSNLYTGHSRTNPATNEWEPSSDVVTVASDKPPRSES